MTKITNLVILQYPVSLIILYFSILYQNIKFKLSLFIIFRLPFLLMQIRIIYLLVIIIIFFLGEIYNFLYFNELLFSSDISILSSNDVDRGTSNDSVGSNMSNGSSSNSDPNLPDSPNSIGNESGVVISQNSNHDYGSNTNSISNLNGHSSSFDFPDEEDDNNFIYYVSNSEDTVRFNEIEYDPQFDDLEFNPCVLYHIDHPYFERMVHQQIAENNTADLAGAIISSNKPEWDLDSKSDAINFIENIVY
jgi:hypothetical protein